MEAPRPVLIYMGFPCGSDGKESACTSGDLDSIPRLENPLEKGMATQYSVFARRILWTEGPGTLQGMESQRVWHNWVINTHTLNVCIHYILCKIIYNYMYIILYFTVVKVILNQLSSLRQNQYQKVKFHF